MSEYIILNCEACKKPVVKMHKELLGKIREGLHYSADDNLHFYHIGCPGGFESAMKYTDYTITKAGCHLLDIEQRCGQEQATAWGRALLGIAEQRTENIPTDEEAEISKHLATGAIEKKKTAF